MIILTIKNRKNLVRFLLDYDNKKSKDLSYVKKHMTSGKELDIFQYKSYYLLIYVRLEEFYRLFAKELICIAEKENLRSFSPIIRKDLEQRNKSKGKVYITGANVYAKIYDKKFFLNNILLKNLSDLNLLVKRKMYCKNLDKFIVNEISKKLSNLKKIRNELVHNSYCKAHTNIDDYKDSLEELIALFDALFSAIVKWIES